eukprot:CAMPEP_0182952734 /NCGR_PEP_ID=MMETSP0105_2-20130417/61922_1 /TAXON_ID=81532 ORGANISM="Acanthoeca-like sp., Strain 10tr" /NCGR_SAMPLE_ID=MMETSP0105_2 /ASSEMBLY_ACC=CAM_ASM_000205 /LENGTH=139 /DNA_ID=CAMNT_0025093055 /DNA_START=777 /DNA_END=1197 /DNA_ORIENTATION=+
MSRRQDQRRLMACRLDPIAVGVQVGCEMVAPLETPIACGTPVRTGPCVMPEMAGQLIRPPESFLAFRPITRVWSFARVHPDVTRLRVPLAAARVFADVRTKAVVSRPLHVGCTHVNHHPGAPPSFEFGVLSAGSARDTP